MKKIMKYFFSVPFKTDFFHWFLRIDRIKIYQFSIQVIGNAAKLLPLKNRCTDFLWNFYFTDYSFPFFQKDFFFPVICGYTAFTVDLTDNVLYGQDNLLCVRLDSRENLNVPPFGYVIDYMTYGGIYRDVRLEVKEKVSLSDIFVHTAIDFRSSPVTAQITSESRNIARHLRDFLF